jgi:chromosome segregation ATPase
MTASEQPLPTPEAALEARLAKLEAEEQELSRIRRRLFDRIDLGADEAHKARLREQEQDVSRRRRDLHGRIDALRAERDALYLQRQLRGLAHEVETNPPDGVLHPAAP